MKKAIKKYEAFVRKHPRWGGLALVTFGVLVSPLVRWVL